MKTVFLFAALTVKSALAVSPAIQVPLSFESNQGQLDPSVDFVLRHSGYDFLLHPGGATAILEPTKPGAPSAMIRWEVLGMDQTLRGQGEAPVSTVSHYIGDADRSRWKTHVPHFEKVRYRETYPGIDLVYYESNRLLEYDFVVAPGANAEPIRVRIHGADTLLLRSDGALEIATAAGLLVQQPPVAFQDDREDRVAAAYQLLDNNTFSFTLGDYDRSQPLTIDPPLAYATFLGGSQADYAQDLAVDAAGNAYLIGWTNSTDFPVSAGVFQDTFGIRQHAFVAKLDPSGSSLLWSTYIGASTGVRGYAIALDSQGRPAISGTVGAQSDLFTTPNAVQSSVGLGEHVFAGLLAEDGSDLLYSTFLSGFNGSGPGGIDVGQSDELFVAGRMDAANFPIVGGYQPASGGSTDAFIARLDPDAAGGAGSSLKYSSYLGGANSDVADSIAAADDGTAVITGLTKSTNPLTALFPVKNASQPDPGGQWDAFVARLDSNASGEDSLIYATFLGGSLNENGGAGDGGIALDNLGNAVVGGVTDSVDFPATADAFQPVDQPGIDGFIASFTGSGQLIWATYLGGSANDMLSDLSVDPAGRIGITGTTDSSDFPVVDPFQPARTNSTDAYIAVLNPDGESLAFSSFLGGSGGLSEIPTGVAFDAAGAVFAAGTATDGRVAFPTTPGAFQPDRAGAVDAYLIKVGADWAKFVDPTFSDLERLRSDSSEEVSVRFGGGFPRSLRFEIAASNADPIITARGFLETYPALFQQLAPSVGGNPENVALSRLHVASLRKIRDGGREADVVTFFQTLAGVPVFGAKLALVIGDDAGTNKLQIAMGALLAPAPINTLPNIDPATAAEAAIAFLSWPDAVVLGARLMIFDPSVARGTRDPRLVWAVTLGEGSQAGPINFNTVALHEVLIDAQSGAGVFDHSFVYESQGLDSFDLRLMDGENEKWFYACPSSSNWTYNGFALVADESGLAPAYVGDSEAAMQWWHWRNTYAYFHNTYGFHSFDGEDGKIYATINSKSPNAWYVPGCGFEAAQGWVSLDVTAHEYTHGIIDHSSELVYKNVSGALNESYADIMGALADDADWLIAEDRTNGEGAIRSLSDPLGDICGDGAPCGQPDRFSDFVVTQSDKGGVHANSGIPNKAHYLMAEGGIFNGVNVGSGMGRSKMGQIAAQTMLFLPSMADFLDARDDSIMWAQWFVDNGWLSMTPLDVCTAQNAWAAVEIGVSDQDCDGINDDTDTDTDNDGWPNSIDNCPNVPNSIQIDSNLNGVGDACEPDADGDSCPDYKDTCPGFFSPCPGPLGLLDSDGDGIGDKCDPDDDGDGVSDRIDNCPWDPNPDQFDGNMNGEGDVCDPDHDGDGIYGFEDNCLFVPNPGQADSDGDGLGDDCDACPDTPDNSGAYTTGFSLLGVLPKPNQPDSDGDGIPDACDDFAFDNVGFLIDGSQYNPVRDHLLPDAQTREITIIGDAGTARIPLPVCGDADESILPAEQRIQLFAENLPGDVSMWVSNRRGVRVADVNRLPQPGPMPSTEGRGQWFVPNCSKSYFLNLNLPATNNRKGMTQFLFTVEAVPDGDFPWADPDNGLAEPDPILDQDDDSQPDVVDNCPAQPNPNQIDLDQDGIGDACDACLGGTPTGFGDPTDCEQLFSNGFEIEN